MHSVVADSALALIFFMCAHAREKTLRYLLACSQGVLSDQSGARGGAHRVRGLTVRRGSIWERGYMQLANLQCGANSPVNAVEIE